MISEIERGLDHYFKSLASHAGCFNAVASTGNRRRRLPVAAKMALVPLMVRSEGRGAVAADVLIRFAEEVGHG
jgi:hypothetical protein